jgi:hypothetical protein
MLVDLIVISRHAALGEDQDNKWFKISLGKGELIWRYYFQKLPISLLESIMKMKSNRVRIVYLRLLNSLDSESDSIQDFSVER